MDILFLTHLGMSAAAAACEKVLVFFLCGDRLVSYDIFSNCTRVMAFGRRTTGGRGREKKTEEKLNSSEPRQGIVFRFLITDRGQGSTIKPLLNAVNAKTPPLLQATGYCQI